MHIEARKWTADEVSLLGIFSIGIFTAVPNCKPTKPGVAGRTANVELRRTHIQVSQQGCAHPTEDPAVATGRSFLPWGQPPFHAEWGAMGVPEGWVNPCVKYCLPRSPRHQRHDDALVPFTFGFRELPSRRLDTSARYRVRRTGTSCRVPGLSCVH